MTRALKKVVLKTVGRVGQVYTLSDNNYRPSVFLAFLSVIGQGLSYVLRPLVRPSLRAASVKDEMSYFKLAVTLNRTLWPSYANFITGGQACNIRTTHAWWQRCIDLLMHSSDVIVMDVSRVSTGSSWEIERLARQTLLSRTRTTALKRLPSCCRRGRNRSYSYFARTEFSSTRVHLTPSSNRSGAKRSRPGDSRDCRQQLKPRVVNL